MARSFLATARAQSAIVRRFGAAFGTSLLMLCGESAAAQTPGAPASPAADRQIAAGRQFDGPAAPVLPEVVARDSSGRTTVRAVRIAESLHIDGALDEALYRDVRPMSGFIQIEPVDGELAKEQTEVWLAFDDDNVYVSIRCLDSQMDRLVANEMRRDNGNIFQGNDMVAFMFDPYYDRRNSFSFTINALGGKMDGQVTNEQQYTADWNPVWDLKTSRGADSWTIEAAIPFKSLKYRPGRDQIWGFNVFRSKKANNELSFLSHVPKSRGMQGLRQVSAGATVVGLEAPASALNLDIKPFVTGSLTTNTVLNPAVTNDPSKDAGLDVKWGVTQNLTADFTYRTDFAQVEADDQQVNLTRFSLFFPEKRDFFLENQGTFAFGGVSAAANAGNSDTPTLFYSRRIGLNGSVQVPIQGGGRLTGRVGQFVVGALNIETRNEPVSRTSPNTASRSSASRWARTSIPRSASCGEATSSVSTGSSASVRGRPSRSRSASSRMRPRSTTSRTAGDTCKRANGGASSPSSSRTRTGSTWSTSTRSSRSPRRSRLPRA